MLSLALTTLALSGLAVSQAPPPAATPPTAAAAAVEAPPATNPTAASSATPSPASSATASSAASPSAKRRLLLLDLEAQGSSPENARVITGVLASLIGECDQAELVTSANMRKMMDLQASN